MTPADQLERSESKFYIERGHDGSDRLDSAT